MECRTFFPLLAQHSGVTLTIVRVYKAIISLLNITGNAILIWGLNKTGQTDTISLKFVRLKSICDSISGMSSLVLMTMLPWKYYIRYCWLAQSMQFILGVCNLFSFSLTGLVALDRYLHVRYLQRYPFVFTKKRGLIATIASFCYALSVNAITILPLSPTVSLITRTIYSFFIVPLVLAIFLLYYRAMKELRIRANQLSRSIITQNKALTKTAKRITICIIVLTLPLATLNILQVLDKHHTFIDSSVLHICKWFAFITFLLNAFCSSSIFLSQNRPIQQLLRRVVIERYNRMRSAVGVMVAN